MLQKILNRLVRMVKFDAKVWEEIEHDEEANMEALVIVLAASLLSAIGSAVAQRSVGAFFATLISGALLNWLLWSWLTMFIGTKLFQGQATFWEMARTLGYANAPVALGLLAVIPCLGVFIGLLGLVLAVVFGFFAVREALDLPTEKAIITIVIGWVILVVINVLLNIIL
jgi:hypothetical protein